MGTCLGLRAFSQILLVHPIFFHVRGLEDGAPRFDDDVAAILLVLLPGDEDAADPPELGGDGAVVVVAAETATAAAAAAAAKAPAAISGPTELPALTAAADTDNSRCFFLACEGKEKLFQFNN